MDNIIEKIKVGRLEITLYHNLTNSKKSQAKVEFNGAENWFFGEISHDVEQADTKNIHTGEMIQNDRSH